MSNVVEPDSKGRLSHLPVSIFSTVMGLAGLAIAWQKAHLALDVPAFVWQGIASFTTLLFLGLLAIYGIKIWRFPGAVAAEWKHPVRVNFFPTISICRSS